MNQRVKILYSEEQANEFLSALSAAGGSIASFQLAPKRNQDGFDTMVVAFLYSPGSYTEPEETETENAAPWSGEAYDQE
jgi:hypothetical protein